MNKSYVEYTLDKCSVRAVWLATHHYKTKDELLSEAKKGFCGTNNILGQGKLVNASLIFIGEGGYINFKELGNDAQIIYNRCVKKLAEIEAQYYQRQDINLDKMFDVLADVNWLFASQFEWEKNKNRGRIPLIEKHNQIHIILGDALNVVLYDSALYDNERSEQYESAISMKYQILSGIHPDSEVRELFSQGYTGMDFKNRMEQARECGIQKMALFYALTATAALYEEYRRTN